MKGYYQILEKCPLFDGIRAEELGGMLGCMGARVTSIRKGQPVLCEGDATGLVGVVLTGSVRLVREDYRGNRSVVTHIAPTQLFGEAHAFSGALALPVSVVPDEDGHVLLLDSRRLATRCVNSCGAHDRVIFNLLKIVSTKNLMLHQKIDIASRRTTRDKLMTYLSYQAKQNNSSSFSIPYDRQALADYLEVDRSGLSAEISRLRKEGVLECEKNRFRLL